MRCFFAVVSYLEITHKHDKPGIDNMSHSIRQTPFRGLNGPIKWAEKQAKQPHFRRTTVRTTGNPHSRLDFREPIKWERPDKPTSSTQKGILRQEMNIDYTIDYCYPIFLSFFSKFPESKSFLIAMMSFSELSVLLLASFVTFIHSQETYPRCHCLSRSRLAIRQSQ